VTAPVNARKPYPSDVTDEEWALIQPCVPRAKTGGRREEQPKREILTAICYVVRSGCAWRMLPHDFPPWQSVYH
jgi:transposase